MHDRHRAAIVLLLLPLLASSCASGPLATSSPAAGGAGPTGGAPAVAFIEGTLVDTHCYSLDRAHASNDHRILGGAIDACAQACAKLGIPVGLLTDSGEVVVLLVPSPDLADHMGREARAVGRRVLNGAMRPDSIFVRDSTAAWTPVPIHQMM